MDNVRGWTNDGPLDDAGKNVKKIGKFAEEFGTVRTIIKKSL